MSRKKRHSKATANAKQTAHLTSKKNRIATAKAKKSAKLKSSKNTKGQSEVNDKDKAKLKSSQITITPSFSTSDDQTDVQAAEKLYRALQPTNSRLLCLDSSIARPPTFSTRPSTSRLARFYICMCV